MVAGGCIETRKIMKITALETIRNAEFPNLLWLHIHTDEGLSGLGETFLGPRQSKPISTRALRLNCWVRILAGLITLLVSSMAT